MALNISYVPASGESFASRAQEHADLDGRVVGIGVVTTPDFTIHSTSTDALRALAAALLEAAKLADAITEREANRLDRAAARAVNSNRITEPFGSVPDRMPARVPAPEAGAA